MTKFKTYKKSLSCCFCFKSSPLISFDENCDEACEYVVEKLVIKKVPIKHFATPEDLKDIYSKTLLFGTSDKIVDAEKDKCLTFSSYSQIIPSLSMYPPQSTQALSVEHAASVTNVNVGSDSVREEMTSGRRRQLEECSLKWTTAEIHKNPVPSVTPAKLEAAPTIVSSIQVDASVKETIDLLGTQKPSIRRRYIARDPDTGRIKDVFHNGTLDVVKLDEIYSATPNKSDTQIDQLSELASTVGLKWKIIIKHKNEDYFM